MQDTSKLLTGLHLIFQATGCNRQKINDEKHISQTLLSLLTEIKMTRVGGPYTVRIGDQPDKSGITSVVLMSESHASIHTWPEFGYFEMDIYSCKTFDVDKALEVIKKAFDVKQFENLQVIKR